MSAFEQFLNDNPDVAEKAYGDAMAVSLSRTFLAKANEAVRRRAFTRRAPYEREGARQEILSRSGHWEGGTKCARAGRFARVGGDHELSGLLTTDAR
jgi:hypothetical protein